MNLSFMMRNLHKRAFQGTHPIKKIGGGVKNKITCPLNQYSFHHVCVAFKVDYSFVNIRSLFWKIKRNIKFWSLTSNPWRNIATGLIVSWSHVTLFAMERITVVPWSCIISKNSKQGHKVKILKPIHSCQSVVLFILCWSVLNSCSAHLNQHKQSCQSVLLYQFGFISL